VSGRRHLLCWVLRKSQPQSLDLFLSSGEGKETSTLLGPLESGNIQAQALCKGPNRVCVFLPSSEEGNKSSFRNAVSSSYLESRTMDLQCTHPVTQCCTPRSAFFRLCHTKQQVKLCSPIYTYSFLALRTLRFRMSGFSVCVCLSVCLPVCRAVGLCMLCV
jgi:hypothetical protein